MPDNLEERDLNFLRGLVRRKMRDQRNGAWTLKRKIEDGGGEYEPDLQSEGMDYVESVYEKLGGNLDTVDLRERPPATR